MKLHQGQMNPEQSTPITEKSPISAASTANETAVIKVFPLI